MVTSIVIRNVSRKASQCFYKKLDGFTAEDLTFWSDYFDIQRDLGKLENCSIIKKQYGKTNKVIIEFTNDKKEAVKAFAKVDQYLNGVDDED